MTHTGLNRLAGLVALTAFAVYSAGTLSVPPEVGFQQPDSAGHLWLISPELPVGQVPTLVEQHRLSEAGASLTDATLASAHLSRGPPA